MLSRRSFVAASGLAATAMRSKAAQGGRHALEQAGSKPQRTGLRIPGQVVTAVSADRVSASGSLSARYFKNQRYLLWRYDHDSTRMLGPFQERETWERNRDWDGEYAGKWLDAAVTTAASTQDKTLREAADVFARKIRATQEPDGYLGTELYRNRLRAGWPLWIHWYATKALLDHYTYEGSEESLAAAVRAGEWVLTEFSPVSDSTSPFFVGAHGGTSNMAMLDELVRLYVLTGEQRWLDFAAAASRHHPALRRMRQTRRLGMGHAYAMLTYLGGAALVARATGDGAELDFLEALWREIANTQLFPTASISSGESFTTAPPQDVASGHPEETCATVEWMIYSHRLHTATGKVRYAHMIERIFRNALLAAQSNDGMKWSYFTPLRYEKARFAGPTECCYFSGPRGVALLPELIYGLDDTGLRVNLLETSGAAFEMSDSTIRIEQESEYPGRGEARFRIHPARPLRFSLKLRIPEHARSPRLVVKPGGERYSGRPGEYLVVHRSWNPGDEITLEFETPSTLAGMADGSAAFQRGEEVLSADLRDNPDLDLDTVKLLPASALEDAPSKNGRRRYQGMAICNGTRRPVIFTPYAEAGNPTPGFVQRDARFRTCFPISGS